MGNMQLAYGSSQMIAEQAAAANAGLVDPYWNLPTPPFLPPNITVQPDALKVLAQQATGITPISWANASYVAEDWWGRYKYYIVGGFALLAIALTQGRRR